LHRIGDALGYDVRCGDAKPYTSFPILYSSSVARQACSKRGPMCIVPCSTHLSHCHITTSQHHNICLALSHTSEESHPSTARYGGCSSLACHRVLPTPSPIDSQHATSTPARCIVDQIISHRCRIAPHRRHVALGSNTPYHCNSFARLPPRLVTPTTTPSRSSHTRLGSSCFFWVAVAGGFAHRQDRGDFVCAVRNGNMGVDIGESRAAGGTYSHAGWGIRGGGWSGR